MATAKIQTGTRIEEKAYKKLLYMAKKQKRSLNAEIEYAIEQAIERFEKENGPILVEEIPDIP